MHVDFERQGRRRLTLISLAGVVLLLLLLIPLSTCTLCRRCSLLATHRMGLAKQGKVPTRCVRCKQICFTTVLCWLSIVVALETNAGAVAGGAWRRLQLLRVALARGTERQPARWL